MSIGKYFPLTTIRQNRPIVVMHTENPKCCRRNPPNDGPVISLKRAKINKQIKFVYNGYNYFIFKFIRQDKYKYLKRIPFSHNLILQIHLVIIWSIWTILSENKMSRKSLDKDIPSTYYIESYCYKLIEIFYCLFIYTILQLYMSLIIHFFF